MSLQLKERNGKQVFLLQEHQKKIIDSQARTIAVFAGIQSGKTVACAAKLAKLIQDNPGKKFGLTGPQLRQIKNVTLTLFIDIIKLFGLVEGKEENWHNKTDQTIKTQNGSIIYYASADDPERLQGLTLKAFWGDEMQRLNDRGRTYEVMQQRTSIERGQVIISGIVPKPDELVGHWIWEQVMIPFQNGDKNIELFSFHSIDNIFFSSKEYEKKKKELAPEVFASDYEGKPQPGMVRDRLVPSSFIPQAIELWQARVRTLPESLLKWCRDHQPEYLGCEIPTGADSTIPGDAVDIAVDVARFGGDRNVFTILCRGIAITQLDCGGQSVDGTAGELLGLGRELRELGFGVRYWIDVPGIGQGVFDILSSSGSDVYEYHPQMPARDNTDVYSGIKSETAWNLRTAIMNGEEALPPIEKLAYDLTRYKYKYQQGRLVIIDPEPSPDFGDSYLVGAFAKNSFVDGPLLLGLD